MQKLGQKASTPVHVTSVEQIYSPVMSKKNESDVERASNLFIIFNFHSHFQFLCRFQTVFCI